jgi:hypothetical protein
MRENLRQRAFGSDRAARPQFFEELVGAMIPDAHRILLENLRNNDTKSEHSFDLKSWH